LKNARSKKYFNCVVLIFIVIFVIRIFRDYGNIPGLDIAYMKNGYVYHTVYDTEENIPAGSIQRAGSVPVQCVPLNIIIENHRFIEDSRLKHFVDETFRRYVNF